MTLMEFLIIFSCMVLLGGPFIAGWYIITRGEWYVRPDGSFRKYGMIFKEWSLFWEQYRKTEKVYYSKDELKKKYDILQSVRPDLAARLIIEPDSFLLRGNIPLTTKEERDMKDLFGCNIFQTGHHLTYIYLSIDEPIHMFPSWVRKPISECIICMSSVYGSAIYWFIALQVKGLFSWSSKENLAKLGFWFIFCVILSCYNKFLQQKLRLDV